MPEPSSSLTLSTFLAEADAFRKKLGEKSFWALPSDDRINWFKQLSWSYFRLEPMNSDDQTRAAHVFVNLQEEFERRSVLILKLTIHDFLRGQQPDNSRG